MCEISLFAIAKYLCGRHDDDGVDLYPSCIEIGHLNDRVRTSDSCCIDDDEKSIA